MTVLVTREVMVDVTWMVVVGSAVLELTLMLLLLESGVPGSGVLLAGSSVLLRSGVGVLEAGDEGVLLLGAEGDVLGAAADVLGAEVDVLQLVSYVSP